jgi:hypothetical protein
MIRYIIPFFLVFYFPCASYGTIKKELPIVLSKESDFHRVLLLPMHQCFENRLPWDLCKELSSCIQQRLSLRENLHLEPNKKLGKKIRSFIDNFSFNNNVSISPDIGSLFPNEEFVIFTKLLKHEEEPIKKPFSEQSPTNLQIEIELLVLDFRKATPTIVVQESISRKVEIPKEFNQYNFEQISWGQDGFYTTPLGLIHLEIAREIAAHIESSILKKIKKPLQD